jgi:hypothetical protein
MSVLHEWVVNENLTAALLLFTRNQSLTAFEKVVRRLN